MESSGKYWKYLPRLQEIAFGSATPVPETPFSLGIKRAVNGHKPKEGGGGETVRKDTEIKTA